MDEATYSVGTGTQYWQVFLTIFATNTDTRRFYQKLVFQEEGYL